VSFTAVILAGGLSRRMGRDKALIQFEGQSLLSRAESVVRAAGAAEVLVSGRSELSIPNSNLRILLDLEPGGGPLGGIERGLYRASHPLVLMLAVDMPRMRSEVIQELLAACEACTGVIPCTGAGLEPLAAFYPRRCHSLALRFLQTARRSARDFAGECLRAGATREFHVPAHLSSCFENWNAPSDIP
jgi:molybdopterin-guanine dinucleotide biosynthesis protein A